MTGEQLTKRGRPRKEVIQQDDGISEVDRRIAELSAKREEDMAVIGKQDDNKTSKNKKDVKFEKIEEAEYSATIITDFSSKIDPFILTNKDPNFAYRFLRVNDKNITEKTSGLLHQKGAWQICPKEHLLRIGIPPDRLNQDGRYYAGDTVLAFMPKRIYEKKMELKKLEAEAPMNSIRRAIKEGKKDKDVDVHDSMVGKGLQTAKALGFK